MSVLEIASTRSFVLLRPGIGARFRAAELPIAAGPLFCLPEMHQRRLTVKLHLDLIRA
jgi:hypothetical protein